ncbi:MAG: PAS domain-containing protein [Spirochaetes bacterium]|nr:PAS domain-containing protein [Spirochaetota bacterium]
MNILTTVCIFIFMIDVYLGLHVLLLDKKSKIHRLFFLLCLCQALWAVVSGIIFSADDKQFLIFIFKTSGFIWIPYFALLLHFCLTITNIIKLKPLHYIFLYFPALILVYGNLVSYTLYSDFIKTGNQWIFVVASDSGWFYFHSLYIIFNMGTSLVLLLLWKRRTKSIKEKKQAVILFVTLFLVLSINIIEGVFLPRFTDYETYAPAPIFIIIFMLGIWYSIVKYRFLAITPALVAGDIIANIDEVIILADNKSRVLTINNMTELLLEYKEDEIKSRILSELILEKNPIGKEIKELTGNDEHRSFSSRIHLVKKDGSQILLDAKFKTIYDKFGDRLGILIIGREVRELKQFKSIYKMTAKQTEIIQYILQGRSNKEIAALLGITERTIKGHISAIYFKLRVNNKMGLYNILKDFNLLPEQPAEKSVLIL